MVLIFPSSAITRSSSSRMRCSNAAFCEPASDVFVCCALSRTLNIAIEVAAKITFFMLTPLFSCDALSTCAPAFTRVPTQVLGLEIEAQLGSQCSRCYIMRAAKRREKVVQRHFVRQINDRELR